MKLLILHIWFFLTAWIPRPFPKDSDDWEYVKKTLHVYFGVPDKEMCWMAAAAQVMSAPAWKMRRSYQYLANVAIRQLIVNDAARAEQQKMVVALHEKLHVAVKKEVAIEEAEKNGQTRVSGEEALQVNAQAHPTGP